MCYGFELVLANSTSATEDSSQDPNVKWQESPSRRGTLAIVQSCLVTMFACTWSVQHLNVPDSSERAWRKILRKCKWMVLTLVLPEVIMAHAILELSMAINDMDVIRQCWDPVRLPWWLRILQRILGKHEEISAEDYASSSYDGPQEVEWTLIHCYFANMGGFAVRQTSTPSQVDNQSAENNSDAELQRRASSMTSFPLTTAQLVKGWRDCIIPSFTEADIQDKSKSDFFTKLIAVVQISSLVFSIITRSVRHLAFSQLETLTLAFAICGVLTYAFYWYKPQNVGTPFIVDLHYDGDLEFHQTFETMASVLTNAKLNTEKGPRKRIPNDNIPPMEPQTTHTAIYLLAILSAGFGSLHAIAWNFDFPTSIEKTFWRVATLVSIIVPPTALIAIPISQYHVGWEDPRDFMRTCSRVMREFSRESSDKMTVFYPQKHLEEIYNDPERPDKLWVNILGEDQEKASSLSKKMLEFIEKKGPFIDRRSIDLPKDFPKQFKLLTEVIDGKFRSKKLTDSAQTNLFPRRNILPESVNIAILLTAGIIYCLARLSIIALAFSSLRSMPDSVYKTTWAKDIPNVS
ncbi:uncharacterized protein LY89DRAFT_785094 [Mollisia scopiformis]|uniref:Uncharacterized protein n=1 Tax=Mollisia scopiformis TaxID=149040 RepID=A0A194WZK0_MOLSC|nr:uncharacterized protein LY89DRAFT_785094 [Mollisia scopiformis]KUJ13376.1 hypothetical protein LY89DRAFT_785094 [Mollisia scopiformis]